MYIQQIRKFFEVPSYLCVVIQALCIFPLHCTEVPQERKKSFAPYLPSQIFRTNLSFQQPLDHKHWTKEVTYCDFQPSWYKILLPAHSLSAKMDVLSSYNLGLCLKCAIRVFFSKEQKRSSFQKKQNESEKQTNDHQKYRNICT